MARISLLGHGTRGDIQPFAAVALALASRSHEVTLAAPVNYRAFVERLGIRYHPVAGDTEKLLQSPEGKELLSTGNIRELFRRGREYGREIHGAMKADLTRASHGADAIVAGFITLRHGLCLAELNGSTLIGAMTFPIYPATGEMPNPLVTHRAVPFRTFNRFTHRLFERAAWRRSDQESLGRWRKELGLPPLVRPLYHELRARKVPMLHWYSPHVVPKPADWSDDHHVTGPLFLEADRAIPEGLERWLGQGAPPVFWGLGSIPLPEEHKTLELLERVARRLSTRFVIASPDWARGAPAPSERVFPTGSVSHDWLFPRCSLVIHHGGAGTTFAALKAGRPAVVAWFYMDQPFWGRMIEGKGLGMSLPYRKLGEETLVEAIQRAGSPVIRQLCEQAAEKIRGEEGLERSCDLIEHRLRLSGKL